MNARTDFQGVLSQQNRVKNGPVCKEEEIHCFFHSTVR